MKAVGRMPLIFCTPLRVCDLILLDHDVHCLYKQVVVKNTSEYVDFSIKPNAMNILRIIWMLNLHVYQAIFSFALKHACLDG